MVTNEGTLRGMTFQATEKVRKPLAAVKRIVEAGHAVVFLPDNFGGSFILNLETGEENGLREDDGNYMLDVWIPPRLVLWVFRGAHRQHAARGKTTSAT